MIIASLGLPHWGELLVQGVLIFVELSCAAVVLSRLGRSPYLAFIAAFPYLPLAGFWYLAFAKWPPALKKKA